MISNLIVMLTLVLAGIYFLCWLLRKDFRRQVEAPKYRFLEQLYRYEDGRDGAGRQKSDDDDRQ